jgi:peptidyl-tRNA hydrolase, PTH1 family
MHLIIGLGNPGSRYADTRHNLGFLVVDEIAKHCKVDFKPAKGEYWLANCSLNDTDVAVLKPVTYMNDSGVAVREFLEQCEVPLENLIVICDDFRLPLGTIRIRNNGSDGGHNGLSSIIYHLQSHQLPRLRCGIASANMPVDKTMMKDFVLENFHPSEIAAVNQMILRARDACLVYLKDGIEQAMNQFNANLLE